MQKRHDTIAAIATPPGPGGIAILRLSGQDVRPVLAALFAPAQKSGGAFHFRPRHLHYGQALDMEGHFLDEALAVHMPGPRSATGEDVGEIHCHGGIGIITALLEAALHAGARLAEPGEFTRRAFLNGRMDLTRAEAVAEIVGAPTREGARLAAAKLRGGLARAIADLRSSLDNLRIQMALAVDFSAEDAGPPPCADLAPTISKGRASIRSLLEAFARARLWREGAMAVLAGRVNAGKSSLLNALLGRPRAIVSEEPGTTRDYIEESINLKGLPLRLADTAGLRADGGTVEKEGIRRASSLAAEADLILFVADARYAPGREERLFFRQHLDKLRKGRLLLVLNKIDLLPPEPAGSLLRRFIAGLAGGSDLAGQLPACPGFVLSARTGAGLEELAAGLRLSLDNANKASESAGPTGDIAPNLRQSQLLQQADAELQEFELALELGYPPEILSVHLEAATACLDEVTGSTGTEELLDRIFSSFCIGK